MSNQHTENHNEHFAFVGALEQNHHFESFVEKNRRSLSTQLLQAIPWRQYHRVNIKHGRRHSNGNG